MKFLRLPFGLVLGRDKGTAVLMSGLLFDTHLTAVHRDKDGNVKGVYDLGSGVVTTAGVNYMAADFAAGANDINLFKFHDSGTGTNAAVIGDTDLQTPAGPVVRATGSQGAATNQYTTVGTITYAGNVAVTEWGLFTQSARASGTMWDRKVFAVINVVATDSIQFTYVLTITAGG